VFGADIIAGFPTEDEAMFANTLAIVKEADLTHLHVFPYSPREGTPAARMPQVSKKLVRDRAGLLRAAAQAQFQALCASRVGQTEQVLMERGGQGRSEQYIPVRVAGTQPGALLAVRISGVTKNGLVGEAVRKAA